MTLIDNLLRTRNTHSTLSFHLSGKCYFVNLQMPLFRKSGKFPTKKVLGIFLNAKTNTLKINILSLFLTFWLSENQPEVGLQAKQTACTFTPSKQHQIACTYRESGY